MSEYEKKSLALQAAALGGIQFLVSASLKQFRDPRFAEICDKWQDQCRKIMSNLFHSEPEAADTQPE